MERKRMLSSNSKNYEKIREHAEKTPVIETHEHYVGKISPVEDILSFVISGYYNSDIYSSAFGHSEDIGYIGKKDIPFEKRYPVFEKLYSKSCHTSYAKCMVEGLKDCWGIKGIDKNSLKELEEKFQQRNQSFFEKTMSRLNIKAMIINTEIENYIEKNTKFSPICKFAFNLPKYHNYSSLYYVGTRLATFRNLEKHLGYSITCLDEFLEAFEIFLKKAIKWGVVCIKDQSAYVRKIQYSNSGKGEAEIIFNRLLTSSRKIFGTEEITILDDFLFHHYMRLARKYDLPVQIHTGHMAGLRNDIVKTNAVHFTSVLELHKDVRFDLFHGNWPYLGELLFLGKNYPNVAIDLCWVNAIDPLYSVELLERALVTVPHTKIHAFGGDTREPEWVAGSLKLARDNVALALSNMTDKGWIGLDEAKKLCEDWFFNNPNNFFNLNL